MLEQLSLRNFQAHKSLTIPLAQVTTIVGNNDLGKSAVLRALRWLCLNKPSGSSFIRHGASRTRVSLTVDGHKISRTKGKGQNSYRLDGKEFKAMGTTVPPEIAKLLNVSEINFQRQHDPAFWFHLTPGQVGKELNQIIDLASIDKTLSHLNSKLRKSRAVCDVSRERLQTARDEHKRLRWVPRFRRDVKALDEQRQRIDAGTLYVTSLRTLIVEGTKSREIQRRAAQGTTRALQGLKTLGLNVDTILTRQTRVDHLTTLISHLEEKRAAWLSLEQQLQKRKALLEKRLGGRCPVCGGLLTQ